MVIPPLVLVAAMQLSGPQDGQAVDAGQIPPWQDIPPVVQTLSKSDIPEIPNPISNSERHVVHREQFDTPPGGWPSESLGSSIDALPDMVTPSRGLPPTSVPGTSSRYSPTTSGDGSLSPYLNQLLTDGTEDVKLYGDTMVYDDRIEITNATVREDYAPIISAPIPGTLKRLQTPQFDASGQILRDAQGKTIWTNIRRGTMVFKDQIIANLDDRIPQAQKSVAEAKMKVAKREAEKQIEVEYAKASLDVYRSVYEISLDANLKATGAVSYAELMHQYTQCVQANLQIQKAEYDLETKGIELDMQKEEINVAETQIDLRQIKAPITGMVVELTTEAGNFLREGDALMKILQLDKLKISGRVKAEKVDQRMVDKKPVTVRAKLPGGRVEEFDGIVRFASPVIKNGREFDIEVEVTNRMEDGYWLLNPGKNVDLTIHYLM